MGSSPGSHTPTYPLNTPSTFGAMPENHYFEAEGHTGGFVKRGGMARPARIWTSIQETPGAAPIALDPSMPVRYFNGQR